MQYTGALNSFLADFGSLMLLKCLPIFQSLSSFSVRKSRNSLVHPRTGWLATLFRKFSKPLLLASMPCSSKPV